MAQASCCWNCAAHTSLVYELTSSPCFAHKSSRSCWCLISNHTQHFEFSYPKPVGAEQLALAELVQLEELVLKFENYDQMESSPLMEFLCSQNELRITIYNENNQEECQVCGERVPTLPVFPTEPHKGPSNERSFIYLRLPALKSLLQITSAVAANL